MDLTVHVGPLTLKNPLMAASGTFGYGREVSEFGDVGRLGAVVGKSVTLLPRAGNPPPRVAETAAGMLNSIGLANPGLDAFLTEDLPAMRALGTAVVVNIAGTNVEEYVELARRLDRAEGLDALELNMSCPNVRHGGLAFSSEAPAARELVQAVRQVTARPLIAKLTPNVTDIVPIARAVAAAGADAVSLTNTLIGLAIDWRRRRSKLAGFTGGLSGPAIKPVALRMAWQVASQCDLPVIGLGGIVTVDDVLDYLVVGARAVQVGTANLLDPLAAIRLVDDLERTLQQEGIDDVNALIGTLVAADGKPV
jgi:dihydroorotate dehydrogenase (NAD+) catalytic subunit